MSALSTAIYLAASWSLSEQLDAQLDAAVHTLVASIEVHPTDVEWEPHERKVSLGTDPSLAQPRWAIFDEHDRLVDCSENLTDASSAMLPTEDDSWRTRSVKLSAGNFQAETPNRLPKTTDLKAIADLPRERMGKRRSFTMFVAQSITPMRENLNRLAWTLIAFTLGLLAVAGLCGRWFCRRAIAPVLALADQARTLQVRPERGDLLVLSENHDEVAELGAALNGLLATLRESLERQRRFAGDASHQLRTPLAAMLVAVEVASRQERSVEEYQDVLGTVKRRASDLQQIIETLLAITRQEWESLQTGEIVDLSKWVRRHLENWKDHARSKDIVVECRDESLPVGMPKTVLAQILDNLLDNACKYGDANTKIHITLQRVGECAVLSVRDSGIGIPASELKHLFEPFYRAPSARKSEIRGFGLGLTLSKRLADVFDAELHVLSEARRGSEFRLSIPIETRPLSSPSSQTLTITKN
ncbi:MAG: HAMP domain-containing sensor histidine kinase [Pirellulales bacterium]